MKLIGTRILIKQSKENERKTTSGLFIPDTVKSSFNQGTILSIGTNVVDFNIGQNIIFKDGSGQSFTTQENDDTLIIFEHDIIAIV